MSTGRIKAIVLSAVFLLTLVIGMMQAPSESPAGEQGSTLSAASLPVVCAEWEGRMINPLRGYTEEMDPACMTESVCPLTESMELTVGLYDAAARPRSVSYEVRDTADGRLIERGSAQILAADRQAYHRYSFSLQDLYEEEVCYRLTLTVDMGELTGTYYTQIKKVDAETLEALAEYASDFHDSLFDKSAAVAYSAKLEPNDQSDRMTLAYVDIHGSLDQVSWGSSGAEPASDAWMTIQSLQENLGHFRFDYLAAADFGGAEPVTLRCRETMTLQKNGSAMYLLKYERHVNQLWEAGEDTVSAKGFLLGVQEDGTVQTVSRGSVTAFTVNGELYAYDAKAQRLTSVFSFRRKGENELRTLCGDCSIRIMNVEENGNIEFVVSGYMNGGIREGMSGAVWYSFDAANDELTEKAALSSSGTPQLAQEDTGRLFVQSGDQTLYFCLNRQIIAMDTSTGETSLLVGSEEFDSLSQSSSGTAFAWQSGSDQSMPASIRVTDLEKGISQVLTADEGEFILVLGYMREDLIIGRGRIGDTPLDDGESGRRPLYGLEILDEELQTITFYSFPDLFISGIEIDSERIIVHRYGQTKSGGFYIYEDDDVLLRSDSEASASSGGVTTYQHDTLLRVSMIPLSKLPSYFRMETAGNLLIREGRKLSLSGAGAAGEHFCAYGRGRLLGIYKTPGQAIAAASPEYGYVTDAANGRLLWTWSSMKKSKELPAGAIRTDLPRHLDLTGASYRSLLYFIDQGAAVRWISPDRGELWLTGYAWQEAVLYDPVSGSSFTFTQEEIEEAISRHDNFLWCYMD